MQDVKKGNRQNHTSAVSALGVRLKKRRQMLFMEIKQVAEESGCSTVFVSRLERGLYDSAQIAKLEAVCKVLGYKLGFTLIEI